MDGLPQRAHWHSAAKVFCVTRQQRADSTAIFFPRLACFSSGFSGRILHKYTFPLRLFCLFACLFPRCSADGRVWPLTHACEGCHGCRAMDDIDHDIRCRC